MTDRDILRALGANVKTARDKANLTQECLAELVGVHWQTISNLENGRASIPITTFAKISQALEISPNRLLEGLPEPDRRRFDKIKSTLARRRNRLPKP